MLFTESFITDAGKDLLARAMAMQGKVVWTRAATSSLNTDTYPTADMNALNESTFGTKTSSGVVANAVVNDSQSTVTIYSELTNEVYSGEARTYGAWAKIQGDSEDVLVIVARCGTGITPTTVNPASDGVVKAFVDFALYITAEQAQAVQVSEGWYATQAALQEEIEAREDLAERAVTTHAAGNPSQGEQQHVYGWKIFHNDVSVYGGLSARAITSRRSSGGGPLLTIDPDDGDYGTFETSMRVNFNAFAITDANTGDVCFTIDRTDTSQDTALTVNVPANFTAGITGNVTGNVTGNLTGLIPTVGVSSTPSIGSIFIAYLTASSSTSPLDIGQQIPSGMTIRKASLSLDSNGVVSAGLESAISITTGTYKLMSATSGLSSGENAIALVMRVS